MNSGRRGKGGCPNNPGTIRSVPSGCQPLLVLSLQARDPLNIALQPAAAQFPLASTRWLRGERERDRGRLCLKSRNDEGQRSSCRQRANLAETIVGGLTRHKLPARVYRGAPLAIQQSQIELATTQAGVEAAENPPALCLRGDPGNYPKPGALSQRLIAECSEIVLCATGRNGSGQCEEQQNERGQSGPRFTTKRNHCRFPHARDKGTPARGVSPPCQSPAVQWCKVAQIALLVHRASGSGRCSQSGAPCRERDPPPQRSAGSLRQASIRP